MSRPAAKTTKTTTPPVAQTVVVEPDVELPVAAEPVDPPATATPPTTVAGQQAAIAQTAHDVHELQAFLIVIRETHDDPTIAALAGALSIIAAGVEVLARANA